MEDNWINVISFQKMYLAEIAKEVLEDNGIKAVIMNKQDASYKFGDIEIYVQLDDLEVAKDLIKDIE
ncbi:MAG: DUF2007 domain-containing protein [Bacteroidales bacterium]|nr:DUF2007 domain-containing protein [Bacteroidales bacterium]